MENLGERITRIHRYGIQENLDGNFLKEASLEEINKVLMAQILYQEKKINACLSTLDSIIAEIEENEKENTAEAISNILHQALQTLNDVSVRARK